MKQKRTIKAAGRLASLILLITGLWLLAVSCDKDDPVDPDNGNGNGEPIELKYKLYVGDWGDFLVLVVDPDSNVVVDTLDYFDRGVWSLAVTPGGTRLFVSTREHRTGPGKLYVVDMQTRQVNTVIDEVCDVFQGINNQFFVIIKNLDMNPQLRQIGTLDTLTYEIAIFDTLVMDDAAANEQAVAFHPTRPLMYARVDDSRRLFAYNYEQQEVVQVYDFYVIGRFIISPDGRYLYVAGGPVFDLETDQSVAGIGGNSAGYLALDPDNRYLYITDPGGYIFPPTPTGKIYVYDTTIHQYVAEIDVSEFSELNFPMTESIVVMPDGNTAYVSDWGKYLFLIDLQNRTVIDTINVYSGDGHPKPLVLGVRP